MPKIWEITHPNTTIMLIKISCAQHIYITQKTFLTVYFLRLFKGVSKHTQRSAVKLAITQDFLSGNIIQKSYHRHKWNFKPHTLYEKHVYIWKTHHMHIHVILDYMKIHTSRYKYRTVIYQTITRFQL